MRTGARAYLASVSRPQLGLGWRFLWRWPGPGAPRGSRGSCAGRWRGLRRVNVKKSADSFVVCIVYIQLCMDIEYIKVI